MTKVQKVLQECVGDPADGINYVQRVLAGFYNAYLPVRDRSAQQALDGPNPISQGLRTALEAVVAKNADLPQRDEEAVLALEGMTNESDVQTSLETVVTECRAVADKIESLLKGLTVSKIWDEVVGPLGEAQAAHLDRELGIQR